MGILSTWAQYLFEQLLYWFEHSSTLIQYLFTNYAFLGPVLGIGLPLLESFLPFLPLMGMTVLNVVFFGPVVGFLYTWIGTTMGSYLVFLIIRHLFHDWTWQVLDNHLPKQAKAIKKLLARIEKRGLIFLFILYGPMAFVVSSALVNVTAGLANISKKTFLIGLFSGKFIAIALSTMIGQGVTKIFDNPFVLLAGVAVMIGIYLITVIVEKRYFTVPTKQMIDE